MELKAWPNPSEGIYPINMNKFILGEIGVLNAVGHPVPFSLTEGDETKIDISAQPAGVYLVQVTDNDSTRTVKVVKH